MFLLNIEYGVKGHEIDSDLQYKMFLLNVRAIDSYNLDKIFTIQNVPIKSIFTCGYKGYFFIYNTKCSY